LLSHFLVDEHAFAGALVVDECGVGGGELHRQLLILQRVHALLRETPRSVLPGLRHKLVEHATPHLDILHDLLRPEVHRVTITRPHQPGLSVAVWAVAGHE